MNHRLNRAPSSALLVLGALLVSNPSFSQSSAGGSDRSGSKNGIVETQKVRSRERFNILDWLANQKRITSEQDSRLVRNSSLGSGLDLVLRYYTHSATLARNGAGIGSAKWTSGQILVFFNDLVSSGNKDRNINVDVGFEGMLNEHGLFQPSAGGSQTSWGARETAGGLVFRPFGRSSQDTGLFLRAGYLDLQERGLWASNENTIGLSSSYWGADFKLYLLNFLGGRVSYLTTFEADASALSAKWQMSRFKYSAFIEFFLLGLEVYWIDTKYTLRPNAAGSDALVDQDRGVGIAASLFF